LVQVIYCQGHLARASLKHISYSGHYHEALGRTGMALA